MNDLQTVAKEALLKSQADIFSLEFQEKKYWVKKARGTFSSNLHKFYYKLFPFEVLIPVETKTGQETIAFETSKLELFQQKGINTPKVMFKNDTFFILEDCGRNINSYLRKRDITKEQMYYYLDLLITQLANIHNNNLFHGGAQARNFTYKEGNVYAIDLEDSFENIDLEILQFRDLLLFLLSLTKIRASFDVDYNFIIEKYIALTAKTHTKERVKNLVNKISFLINLSQIKWINRLLGRDVKSFFKLFTSLKKL
jgi:tRNA A-37 threonylcarbamoyl transferase component Bud32